MLRPRRGRWSAACAGWAAHGGLRACLSKRGLRIPSRRLMHGRRRRAVCVTQPVRLSPTAVIDSQASRAVLSPQNRISENPRRPTVAHQPPPSCALWHCAQVMTTSPLHHWPEAITGKSTPSRDATQAPGYLERGAVGGRLHALVGPLLVFCSLRTS